MKKDPCLIQFAETPVFRSINPSDSNFSCQRCGNILIDGYYPPSFIGVLFECGRCHARSKTPTLEPGEVLPRPVLALGQDAEQVILKTLKYDPSIAITIDSEFSEANITSSPKIGIKVPIDLTDEGLEILEQRFEALSGYSSKKRQDEIARFTASGRSCSSELPFNWAIQKLRSCLSDGIVDISEIETNIALQRIYMFSTVDERWKHHPRYTLITREYSNPKAFFHTLGQFIVAEYLFTKNNRIGFSILNNHGESKPDLYARICANEKFFLEVKSPNSFEWSINWKYESDLVLKNLTSIIKKGKQINRSRPGVIVMMINHPHISALECAELLISNILRSHGRSRKSLAGVVAFQSSSIGLTGKRRNQRIQHEYKFRTIANPYCALDPNPLVINPLDSRGKE